MIDLFVLIMCLIAGVACVVAAVVPPFWRWFVRWQPVADDDENEELPRARVVKR